MPVKKKIEEY